MDEDLSKFREEDEDNLGVNEKNAINVLEEDINNI